jgi:hypothetical protein
MRVRRAESAAFGQGVPPSVHPWRPSPEHRIGRATSTAGTAGPRQSVKLDEMVRALVLSAVVAGLGGCFGNGDDQPRLSADPYVGLACGTGYPCERVGVAVVVQGAPARVTATVEGRTTALRKGSGPDTPDRPVGWSGFLRVPGAQRIAESAPGQVTIRVRVVAPDGSSSQTTRTVRLHLGYG